MLPSEMPTVPDKGKSTYAMESFKFFCLINLQNKKNIYFFCVTFIVYGV